MIPYVVYIHLNQETTKLFLDWADASLWPVVQSTYSLKWPLKGALVKHMSTT